MCAAIQRLRLLTVNNLPSPKIGIQIRIAATAFDSFCFCNFNARHGRREGPTGRWVAFQNHFENIKTQYRRRRITPTVNRDRFKRYHEIWSSQYYSFGS